MRECREALFKFSDFPSLNLKKREQNARPVARHEAIGARPKTNILSTATSASVIVDNYSEIFNDVPVNAVWYCFKLLAAGPTCTTPTLLNCEPWFGHLKLFVDAT